MFERGVLKLVVQKTFKTEVTTNHLVHADPDHFAVNDELYDL
jgi:hypothetical protein